MASTDPFEDMDDWASISFFFFFFFFGGGGGGGGI